MVKGEASARAQVSFRSACLIGRHQGASEHLRACNYDVTKTCVQLRAPWKVAFWIRKNFSRALIALSTRRANGDRIFVITRFPPKHVIVAGSSVFLLFFIWVFSCVLMYAEVGTVSQKQV